MLHLRLIYKDPAQLKPRARNPRTHTPKQIRQVADSIREFGFVNPVLIDSKNGIVAGHARVEAAKSLGMQDVPTVSVEHMTPDQIRAYVIADNKLAENAGWDRKLLAIELQELSVSFDISVTGFDMGEIDILFGELNGDTATEDVVPDIDRSIPAVSQLGDLWRIGPHYLLCADALKAKSYEKLLGDKKAQLVFTDPPYNVPIEGNVSGLGKNRHGEFAMASGEMTPAEFTRFLETVFGRLCDHSANGSIHFVCMDWRHMAEILQSSQTHYTELKNLCIWAKTNAGMGSLYRSQHELVFVFKNGKAKHINNIELGRYGRNRTNLWTYAGVNTFGSERDSELAMHPTVKPLGLVADAILDCSNRGGIVLDPFAGSGTTLIAAEKTGRFGYGIEFDPHYTDTIIRRFEDVYGLKAIHAENGRPFEEVAVKPRAKTGNGKRQVSSPKKDVKAKLKKSSIQTRSEKSSGKKGARAKIR